MTAEGEDVTIFLLSPASTSGERAALLFRERAAFPTGSIPAPLLEEATCNEDRERACLEYCRRMPGAVCLHLDAGDFALYRNTLWHLGNYVPYGKRATLHDVVDTPEFIAWRQRVRSA